MNENPLTIHYFTHAYWRDLWKLRQIQLEEEAGIVIPDSEIPAAPQDTPRDAHEWDYDHIDEIYLSGKGGFWIAWWEGDRAGHVGGQNLGEVLELRRMYVRQQYRRRGIATALVQALVDHAHQQGVTAIELWTADDGAGRMLYSRMGFTVIPTPGKGYSDLEYRTNYTPGEDEVRMRLILG